MATNYAAEKFDSAIYGIFTAYEPETLQDRVYGCMMTTGVLTKDDFPAGLWDQFKKLRNRRTQVEDEKRGSFRATADTLSDKEAHDWLVEFYEIADEVEEAHNESRFKNAGKDDEGTKRTRRIQISGEGVCGRYNLLSRRTGTIRDDFA